MPAWNADQYLRFADQRTQPCRDLVQRVPLPSLQRAIDLGCGPGNSTAVLSERWPDAHITGLDSSAAMIAAAQASAPHGHWIQQDIGNWRPADRYDLIFSNAALQWLPDHAQLFPLLLTSLAPGGALAVQMPANDQDSLAHRLICEIAQASKWKNRLSNIHRWHVHEPAFYYDVLSSLTSHLDLWTTQYLHVLAGPQEIVQWYKGTGLRPYLDALTRPVDQQEFLAEYQAAVTAAYPPQPDGKVLFPFRRVFVMAQR